MNKPTRHIPSFSLGRIFTLTAILMALFVANTNPSQAQTTKTKQSAATRAAKTNAAPLDVAINKSERQVMLSQRAAKLYAQGALGITPARSDVLMSETIVQFEAELAWLTANAPSPSIKAGVDEQSRAWQALKAYIGKPPVRDNIDEVGETSENLYNKARATALAIEALTVNPLDEVVGQSAKQRVLIQRLGKLYMFERAGFKDAKRKFEEARAEFLDGHKKLADSKDANELIKRELDLIMGQARMLFINFVDGKVGGEQNDALVGKSIEVMMQMQDAVTTLFERL
jgi:hypothetical protein